jgi:hypothetical protein
MRTVSGNAWNCVQDRRRNLILAGENDDWILNKQETAASVGFAAHPLISYFVLLVVGMPLLILKLSLLVHCVRQCKRVDASAPPRAAHT